MSEDTPGALDRFWIVCRVDRVAAHSQYRMHPTFLEAVTEARRLSKNAKPRGPRRAAKFYPFIVMEAIGGFVNQGDGEVQEVKVK